MEENKPKRQMTAEQLENLKKGREAGRLKKIQNRESLVECSNLNK